MSMKDKRVERASLFGRCAARRRFRARRGVGETLGLPTARRGLFLKTRTEKQARRRRTFRAYAYRMRRKRANLERTNAPTESTRVSAEPPKPYEKPISFDRQPVDAEELRTIVDGTRQVRASNDRRPFGVRVESNAGVRSRSSDRSRPSKRFRANVQRVKSCASAPRERSKSRETFDARRGTAERTYVMSDAPDRLRHVDDAVRTDSKDRTDAVRDVEKKRTRTSAATEAFGSKSRSFSRRLFLPRRFSESRGVPTRWTQRPGRSQDRRSFAEKIDSRVQDRREDRIDREYKSGRPRNAFRPQPRVGPTPTERASARPRNAGELETDRALFERSLFERDRGKRGPARRTRFAVPNRDADRKTANPDGETDAEKRARFPSGNFAALRKDVANGSSLNAISVVPRRRTAQNETQSKRNFRSGLTRATTRISQRESDRGLEGERIASRETSRGGSVPFVPPTPSFSSNASRAQTPSTDKTSTSEPEAYETESRPRSDLTRHIGAAQRFKRVPRNESREPISRGTSDDAFQANAARSTFPSPSRERTRKRLSEPLAISERVGSNAGAGARERRERETWAEPGTRGSQSGALEEIARLLRETRDLTKQLVRERSRALTIDVS